jgi:hypothetical protein
MTKGEDLMIFPLRYRPTVDCAAWTEASAPEYADVPAERFQGDQAATGTRCEA